MDNIDLTNAMGLATAAVVMSSLIKRYFYRKEWKMYRELVQGTLFGCLAILAIGVMIAYDVAFSDQLNTFIAAVPIAVTEYELVGKRLEDLLGVFQGNRSADGGNND